MKDKTLLVISGGFEAVPGIRHARDMGCHVVVTDQNPAAPGFLEAHDHLIASTYDIEATVQAAKQYAKKVRPIDGVLSIASDVPMTVASVAASLGLPGIPIESARIASDKLVMKRCFQEKGIPIPWFSEISSLDHLKDVVTSQAQPLVLKPVDSRGARGVLRLIGALDLAWAYQHTLACSPSGRVMVEEYLDGPQISTESILIDNQGYTPGFVDRNYELLERFAPHIIENGGHQPSILSDEARAAVSEMAVDAGRAIGVTTGIVKGDMVYTSDGPKVIEIAPRLSGGWLCTDQIPLATGIDFVGAAIRLALGENVDAGDLSPSHQRGVAIRYFFPAPGRVAEILNTQKFLGSDWLHKLIFFVQPGDFLEPYTNHTRRAGCVITTGETREDAIARAREVTTTIRFVTTRE
ncbi:MAG: ATP-grasp domain-containing protein [Desulfomonilia bacterium]|jgi:biotin carboxylase